MAERASVPAASAYSTPPTVRLSPDELSRLGRLLSLTALLALVVLPLGILGGWELLFAPLHLSPERRAELWLEPPFCWAYFLPLVPPLGLYIVIARWSGEKAFRHS
ncbi:hypothetical protein FA09DRAFT_339591 [Tilletiopsis washingtonensis]|jgi:uncharacterized membrane protein|uniref:Uncharacterized protein n=1 Tax=Tilletiopsis washingtonensis TaxID=58919 RepID=A0A316ZA78_9BASI|nr:hypothetical protein FA09DRAFT_339591 [Tilletiopsis washingtonensis]PWN97103.1 hypothetical protein FA09DRAFT_339591 [Tilletiopsis washingtonensis]